MTARPFRLEHYIFANFNNTFGNVAHTMMVSEGDRNLKKAFKLKFLKNIMHILIIIQKFSVIKRGKKYSNRLFLVLEAALIFA